MIIQSISLSWNKKTRGAPYSTLRNRYNKSFGIPDSMIHANSQLTFPVHKIELIQNENGIEMKRNNVEYVESSLNSWKLGCIEIQRDDYECIVYFNYSDHCGKPIRYDTRNHYLSEKAFELSKNEYGRISYNGRWVHPHTGEWIYRLHILNVYNSSCTDKELLNKNRPMKEYKQLAVFF